MYFKIVRLDVFGMFTTYYIRVSKEICGIERKANHGYEHYIHNLEIVWMVLRKFGYNDQLIRPTSNILQSKPRYTNG